MITKHQYRVSLLMVAFWLAAPLCQAQDDDPDMDIRDDAMSRSQAAELYRLNTWLVDQANATDSFEAGDQQRASPTPKEAVVSVNTLKVPKKALKAYHKAQQQADKGRFESALHHLSAAIAEYPQYAAAWYAVGRIRHAQGQLDAAVTALEKAVKADPKYADAYVLLSTIACDCQHWQDVLHVSEHAQKFLSTPNVDLYANSAVAYYSLKKYEAAERSATQVIRMDPENRFPRIRVLLGLAKYWLGDLAAAAAELRRVLQSEPNGPDSALVREQLAYIESQRAGFVSVD